MLALLPIIVCSILFGTKAGLLSAAVLIPINGFFYYLLGEDAFSILIVHSPGIVGSFIIASAAGYMSDISKKYKVQLEQLKKEIEARRKVEDKIAELQKKLHTNLLAKGETESDSAGMPEDETTVSQAEFGESDYKGIADNAVDIIYTVNNNGYVTYANKAALQTSGYSIEELNNFTYLNFIPVEYKNQVKAFYLKQYLQKKKSTYYEFPFTLKNGLIKWYGQNATLIFEGTDVTGFNVIARDITQRKQMELSLRESETKLRLITESANDAIIICNDSFNIIQWNSAAERMYGYSKTEILGKSFIQLIPNDDRNYFLKKVIEYHGTIESNEHEQIVKRGKRKDSSVFNIEISVADWERKGKVYFTYIIRDITDRIKQEAQIIKERDTAQKYLDITPVIMCVLDTYGNIVQINKTGCEILGYEENELLGNNWFSLLLPKEEQEPQLNSFRKFLESKKQFSYDENSILTKDNEKKNISFKNTILTEPNGEITGVLFSGEDITERRKAQSMLEESEERYRTLFEHSALTVLIIDPDTGRIKNANKAAVKFYGYDETEFQELYVWDLNILPKDEILRQMKTVIASRKEEFTFKHRLKNGEIRDVAIVSGVIKIRQQDLILSSITDITERLKIENELADYRQHLERLVEERTERLNSANKKLSSEIEKLTKAEAQIRSQIEFFQILINTIPLPIYIRNRDKRFMDCNKSFEDFFGLKKKRIIGKSNTSLFPPDVAHIFNKIDEEIFEKEEHVNYEASIHDRLGYIHELIIYQALFKNNKNEIEGTIGVILDISDQKKLQREIKKSLDKEKELGGLRSAFISTVSHEFRTPLTTILSSSDLIELYNKESNISAIDEFVKKIQNAVSYMTDLIDDVLVINKAETGKMELNAEYVDIYDLIRVSVEDAEALSNDKHLFLVNIKVNQDKYFLDKRLFKQVLSNLLSNAVKYSPAGGTIQLAVKEENKKLFIHVADNGIGISEEDQKHLFDVFFRSKKTENMPGTGLGLAIAKKAIELHNGEIYISNSSSKGTTFTFWIPV